ncbi:eukaryotic peptide chain release factor GTP-binding subunit ERF3A-like [Manis pentadactyla]|uniref:eukaryotic peptide chain release factor GTP-binding subunit ERF3A-like n=1 Tax=Manis pentadactyla TaxID=143292 RepID=UPI00255C6A92|nr:eukaryotic peptide chain release factor GTP-binding subunit ERF3A-like isoform X1 [Manis pentadactyla]XP_057342942.1 eukaryotic peptide chain release factor GTP-binding subunit ERF3A-like [Manis pentadactyla]XP_057342943.1 eukaryotic peptide chain release factor GTP-binding subunit ERF3A-like [Manis pentadactyla]XP_057342944.1 eukaryotic peptide chain release factor GTP-binding subunit ERF3A-like [Manis pentadactyla]XP_057342945.1 eukaryotic peptide chain release factor GTP-binding subunit E
MDPGSGGGGGGGSSSGSSSDSAPDCWDQADMEAPGSGPCGGEGGPLAAGAAEAQREHLSAAFSRQLNVNAKPFVPNVHAAEFVPSFLRGPAQPAPAPAPTTTEPAVAREALRAKGPGRGSSRAGGRSPPWWGVGTRLRFASQGGVRAASGPGGTWGADSGAGRGQPCVGRPGRGGGPGGAVAACRRHGRDLEPVPSPGAAATY